MKSVIAVLFFILFTHSLMSQTLSENEAIDFANKLNEVEILSEKGKQTFISNIKKGYWYSSGMPNDPNLSKTHILGYLSQVFLNELQYRSGATEQQRIEAELRQEFSANPPAPEDLETILVAAYTKKMEAFEGYKIEQNILDEDSLTMSFKAMTLSEQIWPPAKDGFQLIHHKRSVLGKTCIRTLNDLLKINLIDSLIHQETLDLIHQHKCTVEFEVLSNAAERAAYYEDFDKNKREELAFISNLNKVKLISDKNLDNLINSYQEWELKSKYDILTYCENVIIINPLDYSSAPQIAYHQIFDKIKSIIPDFDFENFKVSIDEIKDGGDRETVRLNAIVEFEVNGITYSNTLYHGYLRKATEAAQKTDTLLTFDHHFYKGINKLLADKKSSQRLYYAKKPKSGYNKTPQEFGLILMTELQAKAWKSTFDFLSEESYDNNFNTPSIQAAIHQYEKIGLFSHLSEAEIQKGKTKAEHSEITGYHDILGCFPKSILYFDGETGNLDNPYEELVTIYGKLSRGAFTPVNIVDHFQKSWDSETTYFSFEFNGKRYEDNFKMQDDWIDPMLETLIQRALTSNQIDGEFYLCTDGGTFFLTKAQYEFLQKEQPSLFMKF